jgi:hypothetical protein
VNVLLLRSLSIKCLVSEVDSVPTRLLSDLCNVQTCNLESNASHSSSVVSEVLSHGNTEFYNMKSFVYNGGTVLSEWSF